MEYIIACFCGIMFISFFSRSCSPFYLYAVSYDSSFFTIVGRGINEGKIPYKDYCDIKGPVFFLWEALGQRLCVGKGGAYLLELIAIVLCCIALVKICNNFKLSKYAKIIIFLIFFIMYVKMLWQGNFLEEYILPLNMFCVLFAVRWIKNTRRHKLLSFFCGLIFSICVFSKITQAVIVISLLCMISYYFFMKKNLKDAAIFYSVFFAGVLLIAAPILFWFYRNNALYDLYIWTWKLAYSRGVNFNYDKLSVQESTLVWEFCLMPCYLMVIYYVSGIIKRKIQAVKSRLYMIWLFSYAVMCGFVLHFGSRYSYYLILEMPLVIMEVIFLIRYFKVRHKKKAELKLISGIMMVLCFVFLGWFIIEDAGNISYLIDSYNGEVAAQDQDFYYTMKELCAFIPEDERSDIMSADLGVRFFEVNGLIPSNHFPYNLSYFCGLYGPAQETVYNEVAFEGHKWAFTEIIDGGYNKSYHELLNQYYYIVAQGDSFILWHRKG